MFIGKCINTYWAGDARWARIMPADPHKRSPNYLVAIQEGGRGTLDYLWIICYFAYCYNNYIFEIAGSKMSRNRAHALLRNYILSCLAALYKWSTYDCKFKLWIFFKTVGIKTKVVNIYLYAGQRAPNLLSHRWFCSDVLENRESVETRELQRQYLRCYSSCK